MARLGLLLIIGAGFLLWSGGQKIYTGVKNQSPSTLSIDDYEKTKPDNHWLKLTGCSLRVAECLSKEEYNKVSELYVPLRSQGPNRPQIRVLLATRNENLIALNKRLQMSTSEKETLDILSATRDQWFNKDVQGLVRFGIDLEDKDRNEMIRLTPGLAKDFIILDDGEKPSLTAGVGMFCGGLIVAGGFLFALLRARSGPPKKI